MGKEHDEREDAEAAKRFARLGDEFEIALEAFVSRATAENVPTLHEGVRFALGLDTPDRAVRGKRIRPALCLLAAESMGARSGGAAGNPAMPFALAIELMHNFCLVHDDIEDGDRLRRGRPSVWVRYGLPHGINIGDYLLILAHSALLEPGDQTLAPGLRLRLLRLLDFTLDRTHIGQALDMNARGDRDFTIPKYMTIVREKTGHYLAAPIQGGAAAAGAGEDVLERISDLARLLGPVFQIMDDIIDLTEGKGRGSPGSDIREGKRSYMVAHAAGAAEAGERERMFDILDRPRDETSDADVAWVIELFGRTGSIARGHAECDELRQAAGPLLAGLPGPLGRALEPVFRSLAARTR